MTTYFICGNHETLASGNYLTNGDHREEVEAAVDAGLRVLSAEDCKVESFFSDWHGGRFDQFYQRCGFVAVSKDAPPEVVDLAWKANEAIDRELTAQEAQAEESDREWYAELIERDEPESVNWWVVENLLMPAANHEQHTLESIAAALRANDAGLLMVAE